MTYKELKGHSGFYICEVPYEKKERQPLCILIYCQHMVESMDYISSGFQMN